jgi:hypothetical protein
LPLTPSLPGTKAGHRSISDTGCTVVLDAPNRRQQMCRYRRRGDKAKLRVLFLHGWFSNPGGLKPTHLKCHGHEVLNPALPDHDFARSVRIAQAEFDQGRPDVVVGSSRGGAVAMNVDSGDTPLVLLCPAWRIWGMATTVKLGTAILHSPADRMIPFADSRRLLRNSGLPQSALIAVGHDHRLADPESLKAMLEAVERAVNMEAANEP